MTVWGNETTKLVRANCQGTDSLNLCLFTQRHYSFSVHTPVHTSLILSISCSVTSAFRLTPLLPTPSPPVLTSHFLFPSVNINTGLMCTLQMPSLEELTAHIVGRAHQILPYTSNPEAFFFLLIRWRRSWQAGSLIFFFFLLSQNHSPLRFATSTTSLEVWAKGYVTHCCKSCDIKKLCHYQWIPLLECGSSTQT